MTRRPQRWKTIGAIAVAVVLLIGWGAAGLLYLKYRSMTQEIQPKDPVAAAKIKSVLTPAPAKRSDKPTYVLLLGQDRRPGQGRQRSDTILIARMDHKKKQIKMLSIPRDTRVAIPGHGMTKINAANAYGGPQLAIRTVKSLTGLPINHYLEIDFIGFTKVVEAMGGVWVDVDREINDSNGTTAGGVSNVTHIRAGYQKLNAQQALTFVRSRRFANGDFTRIKHQQQLLKAIAKQAMSSDITRLPYIAESASKNIETDMSMTELLELASEMRRTGDDSLGSFTAPGRSARIGGVSYVVLQQPAASRLFSEFAAGTAVPTEK